MPAAVWVPSLPAVDPWLTDKQNQALRESPGRGNTFFLLTEGVNATQYLVHKRNISASVCAASAARREKRRGYGAKVQYRNVVDGEYAVAFGTLGAVAG